MHKHILLLLGNTYKDNCALQMDKLCMKNKIRVVKVIRATMEEIGNILHRNENCVSQIKIVHLLRDPRGRLNSLHDCCGFNYSKTNKISSMCHRQMKDVVIANKLKKSYPGTFLEVQYEQLASDIAKVSENIYNFLFDSNVPIEVKTWMKSDRNNQSETTWSTNRKNSKVTSLAWIDKMSPEAKHVVNHQCRKLISHIEQHRHKSDEYKQFDI